MPTKQQLAILIHLFAAHEYIGRTDVFKRDVDNVIFMLNTNSSKKMSKKMLVKWFKNRRFQGNKFKSKNDIFDKICK
jgi:hypothetical protein